MRTITKTVYVYTFDELDAKAQEKAIQSFSEINVDYEWWETTYDDAKEVGIKITSFDIDRGQNCEGDFLTDAVSVAEKIVKNHGKACESYKTAKTFLSDVKVIKAKYQDKDCDNGLTYEGEKAIEDCEEGFKMSILEDYRIMLQKEYEYQTSSEAIIETIKANEYEFTKEGKFPAI